MWQLFATAAFMILAGCSTPKYSHQIRETYADPNTYSSSSCELIEAELMSVKNRLAQISAVQDSEKRKDRTVSNIARVLFWQWSLFQPAALAIENKHRSSNISQLKGERTALEKAHKRKCSGPSTTSD